MSIKDLFFKIVAKDDSGSAFGSVNRRLRETDGLSASVSNRINHAGKAMRNFGVAGSLATGGIVMHFRDVIGLYDEQARAEAKVAQAIRQTGGAAGFTADQLYKEASALQAVTRFGDEAILNNVTAQLLTFKNISSEVFTDAQGAALDLATVLDGDLQSAAIGLGKALNDPAKGLSALSEKGITFSNVQSDIIKNLAKTGDVAGAQRLILEEIASAYGNQAEAARKAGAGIVDAWTNIWGDVKEAVGGVLVDVLPPVIDSLKSITGWFQELEPEGQRVVVMLGALALAVPPVTAAIGLMAIGVNAMMGPLGIIVGIMAAVAGGAALFAASNRGAAEAANDATTAMGDEITQAQLLSGVIGSNAQMSVQMADKKLAEARARHENVRAIIAENRALVLKSTEYQGLVADIKEMEGILGDAGVSTDDLTIKPGIDVYQAAKSRLAALRVERENMLKVGDAEAEQLDRTEANIKKLEIALAKAGDGVVVFGEGLVTPIKPTTELDSKLIDLSDTLSGVASPSVNDLIKDLEGVDTAVDDAAGAEGWNTIKDNLKSLAVDGQSWGDTWQNIFGSVTDRLFDLAFSPAWDALFENLSSSLSGAGNSGAGGAGGSGGLLSGVISGASGWVGNILGLDTGGDVTVSGKAGIDRNMTVLRTSDSEQVSVRRKGDAGGMGRPVNVYIQPPDPQAFQASRAQIGGQIARAVAAGNRAA